MSYSKRKTKISVSLPGGGLRSFAYLGALKALKENDFEIEAMYAYSGGALVGVLFLLDLDFEETFKRISGPLWYLSLSKRLFRNKLVRVFDDKKIEDLPIPVYFQTVNVNTGKLEVIETGSLADYLVATTNQVLYSPYKYNGGKYLDGGILGSYGTQFLRDKGYKNIIALNVGRSKAVRRGFISKLQILLNLTMQEHLAKDALICPPDFLLNDLAADINSASPKAPRRTLQLGYERTIEKIPEIKRAFGVN